MPQPQSLPGATYPDRMLPGHYDCLTMQCNVTMYPSAGTVRAVIIIRDPISGVELDRRILATTPLDPGIGMLRGDLATRIGHMLYLAGRNDEGRRIAAPDL